MTTLDDDVKIIRDVLEAVWTMSHCDEIAAANDALDRILKSKIVKVHNIE